MSLHKPKPVRAASTRQYTAVIEKFKYLGVVFTSDGRRNREVDTRFGKANAVLLELDRYLVTERELSNIAMLSDFKSVIAPILTYGHEFWVVTERVLSKVQAA